MKTIKRTMEQSHRPLSALVMLAAALTATLAMGQANYVTPYTFTTIAGAPGVAGSSDATNSYAQFHWPDGLVLDTNGNVYVSDQANCTIRKVTPVGTDWVVTTLAGKAGLSGSADGTNSDARFNAPERAAVDGAGNLYLAEYSSCTIRKVTPVGTNWVVTTLAGLAGNHGSADGTNSDARFDGPCGLALDTAGNLYVADEHNNTIREVTPLGTNWVVTTLAGLAGSSGGADGTNNDARFNYPYGVAVDTNGNLYVSDQVNCTIREVTPVGTNWVVTTLAGKAGFSGSADGTNSDARFRFNYYGLGNVTVDGAGNVFVADFVNHTIRKVTPVGTNWVVTTLAGLAGNHGSGDGTGSATRFYGPNDVAVDSAGNLYVADAFNNIIRKGLLASSVPPPMLQPPSLSAGQFGFGITGLSGLPVYIEASGDLDTWQVVGACTLGGGTNSFVNPNPSLGAQFYRVHVR